MRDEPRRIAITGVGPRWAGVAPGGLTCCCSRSTPRPRRSPSPLHDGGAPWSRESTRSTRGGTASCWLRASSDVLAEAGVERRRPDRHRRSASAPARSPGCASVWSPRARWPRPRRSRCTACARSTCWPGAPPGDAAGTEGPFRVATDARRKEVYWARYEHVAHGSVARSPSPRSTARPTCRTTSPARPRPVAGRGAVLYPDELGRPWVRSTRRRPRWLAPGRRRARRRSRLSGRSPLYLRRPDAPRRPPRACWRDRAAVADGADVLRGCAGGTSSRAGAGARAVRPEDAWSRGRPGGPSSPTAAAPRLPWCYVCRPRRTSSATPGSPWPADVADVQTVAVAPRRRGDGPRRAARSTGCCDLAADRGAAPGAAGGARGQRAAPTALRRAGLRADRLSAAGYYQPGTAPRTRWSCALAAQPRRVGPSDG